MLWLMFLRLNVSVDEAKIATSLTPRGERAIEAGEIRHQRGVAGARSARDSGEDLRASAICGTHFGLTNARHFDHRKPRRAQAVDELDLVGGRDDALSFCSPSRGPTSTTADQSVMTQFDD